MSTKITWKDGKTQPETQTHPSTEADFKRPFVLKLKLQGNTEVTFCHFLPSTCCPTVVSCQGDFHSHRRKPPSKVISFQAGCVQTSCQYILLWTISFWNIYKGHMLSSYSRLTIIVFFYLFSWKSIPNQFYLYLRRVDWAHSVTLLYVYTVTHSPLLGAS